MLSEFTLCHEVLQKMEGKEAVEITESSGHYKVVTTFISTLHPYPPTHTYNLSIKFKLSTTILNVTELMTYTVIDSCRVIYLTVLYLVNSL